jgi:predicted nuclease of predicted toxin-antitoxin system
MADRIRFYFDQHVPIAVALGLRRRGIDVLTAQEADLCGRSDEEQLQKAISEQRVLVTFDDDLLTLVANGQAHTGLAFCAASKYTIGDLIRVLALAHEVFEPNEMLNHVEFL